MIDEAHGERVEQLLIAGRVAAIEVVGGLDDAAAEVVGPDAIDEGAGEVGIVATQQPSDQRLERMLAIARLDDIAANRYALTLGIHSRIDATVERIVARLAHGNVYVNRNMIGAVVGTQPFGGAGLSGTGPKAGGPNYLRRFTAEQVVTINTAAAGGNASLLAETE